MESKPNVFVLCTGRSGSMTFARACDHVTNYTAAHESRKRYGGAVRLDYPPAHIEADNRLSWFLGRIDEKFGTEAFYVHLTRDRELTAQSWAKRTDIETGVLTGYRDCIGRFKPSVDPLIVAYDYVDTVTSNIQMFLKDKPNWMPVQVESFDRDFAQFWEWIGAEGDLSAARQELARRHNASNSEGSE